MSRTLIVERSAPEAIDVRSSVRGLRAVATFEILKGAVAILLAFGLLTLIHKDVEHVAENLLVHLHIGPEHHASRAFLRLASHMNDARLWTVSGAAVAYSAVRFVEGYGLWHRRVWAEWFALLSGTLYMPVEIYQATERPNVIHILVLIGNVAIVLYMLWVRVNACWPPQKCEQPVKVTVP